MNPVAPQMAVEHENPTLCIVYKQKVESKDADEKISEIKVGYYSERQKVEILV